MVAEQRAVFSMFCLVKASSRWVVDSAFVKARKHTFYTYGFRYACRRDRATCPAKTVSQLRYTRSNVPITGLTDKLTRRGQIEGLFNLLPVSGGKLFRNTMCPVHRRIFRS